MLKPPPGAQTGDADDAWFSIVRTYHMVADAVDRELRRRHDLSMSWFEVLLRLAGQSEPVPTTHLAAEVLLSPSRLSRVLDTLAARGLVERGSAEGDARVSTVAITSAGAQLYREADVTHKKIVGELLLDKLTVTQVRALASVWDRIAP